MIPSGKFLFVGRSESNLYSIITLCNVCRRKANQSCIRLSKVAISQSVSRCVLRVIRVGFVCEVVVVSLVLRRCYGCCSCDSAHVESNSMTATKLLVHSEYGKKNNDPRAVDA